MSEILLFVAVGLGLLVLVLQIVLLTRKSQAVDLSAVELSLRTIDSKLDRSEQSLREEMARNREEIANAERQTRHELTTTLKGFGDSLQLQLTQLTQTLDQKSETLRQTVDARLTTLQDDTTRKLEHMRQDSQTSARSHREEITQSLTKLSQQMIQTLESMSHQQRQQLTNITEQLTKGIENLRTTVEGKLKSLQEDNAKSLEQMRQTVDEKLQGTLEKRLGESFKQVSERLEAVHKGLGEMQTLASGVGDLKKVLVNVKTRGTWGEVQLGAMLEQVLSPEQYEANVATKGTSERVEFAIKLPGRGEDGLEHIWLPIDAKFPMEDYQRLIEAQEQADAEAVDVYGKQLEARVKLCARDIRDKYIDETTTTGFAILYLPIEGLFAEVVRRPGLTDQLQRDFRVMVAGPTTLCSLLNSLQMGFRTLAIQKRSSEVWKVLGAVKTEFGRFGELLDGVKKRLDQASNTIEDAARKSRTIERKLKNVQELPTTEAQMMLLVDSSTSARDESES